MTPIACDDMIFSGNSFDPFATDINFPAFFLAMPLFQPMHLAVLVCNGTDTPQAHAAPARAPEEEAEKEGSSSSSFSSPPHSSLVLLVLLLGL